MSMEHMCMSLKVSLDASKIKKGNKIYEYLLHKKPTRALVKKI